MIGMPLNRKDPLPGGIEERSLRPGRFWQINNYRYLGLLALTVMFMRSPMEYGLANNNPY